MNTRSLEEFKELLESYQALRGLLQDTHPLKRSKRESTYSSIMMDLEEIAEEIPFVKSIYENIKQRNGLKTSGIIPELDELLRPDEEAEVETEQKQVVVEEKEHKTVQPIVDNSQLSQAWQYIANSCIDDPNIAAMYVSHCKAFHSVMNINNPKFPSTFRLFEKYEPANEKLLTKLSGLISGKCKDLNFNDAVEVLIQSGKTRVDIVIGINKMLNDHFNQKISQNYQRSNFQRKSS